MNPSIHLRGCLFSLAIFLAATASRGSGQKTTATFLPQDQRLQNGIRPLLEQHKGDVGIAMKNLKTGEHFRFHGNDPMPTASLIKLPLMIAAYREADTGRLSLTDTVPLTADDKVPGSGLLTGHISPGVALPLRDYIRLMIRYSDNTATNIVIDQVGLKRTEEIVDSLGCSETKLHSKLYRGQTSIAPERSQKYGVGSTCANEMIRLLRKVDAGTAASPDSCKEMLEHLKTCADRRLLARQLPSNVTFAHKSGSVGNCRTDAGIVYTVSGPIAVCVLTNNTEDQRQGADNDAAVLMGEIGRVIINRFGAEKVSSDLREGAFGTLVESLQRTLNARLTPSPNLSIDGDFGPGTKAALVRFQEANGLKPTAVVTADVWRALGTLIETDAPVAPPSVINQEKLPTENMPALDAPPIVTCESWVIGDPSSGEVVYRSASDQPRQAASTTKIMTAYVVLEFAQRQPDVLDEVITFSQTADDTVGSTAGVRAGEEVAVKDLLFGLMLPSGNDASVALAEHFGAKLIGGKANQDESDPQSVCYAAFVKQMNSTAKQLGMLDTLYKNTHGLPNEEHVTTATDLFRLATQAMTIPRFREIVKTRQFGCTLRSDKGYERNVIWKTTNRLLGIDGYCGIKTGTTNAAGSCLVSCGERDGDQLITVVLGSSSTAARYSDTRNLFRWAWKNRSGNGVAAGPPADQ